MDRGGFYVASILKYRIMVRIMTTMSMGRDSVVITIKHCNPLRQM